jgi:hypothetical protein
MGNLVFEAAAGGSTSISGPNTAATNVINVPDKNGTLVVSATTLDVSKAVATNSTGVLVSVTNTGSGNNVLATSPTLVTPNLGTPSALIGTNITSIPNSGLLNSTISGISLGNNLANLTAGTGISFSAGTTYNGSTAITISSTNGGTVTGVTGTSPVVSSGGATPAISMPAATTSVNGYLTSTDWNTFNGKGSGTVTSVGGTGTVNGITLTGSVTSSGNLTLGGTLSGIGNSQLTNSTISGVALGGSLFSLTAGTNITFSSGTTYNGSTAITINATGGGGGGGTVTSVAGTGTVNGLTLTGTVTSSGNLTLGGTLGSIANSQLTNSSITFGSTAVALGTTVSALNAVSIGATTASTGAFTTLSTSSTTSTTPVLNFNASNSGFASGATISGSYLQSILQNKSGTAGASTNYVLSNDLGTDSTYYGEFGMNSSVFSSGTPADFFSLNNGVYFSSHDGDVTIGSGNGFKTFFAWGSSGQSAHVINASGAIGLNTSITGSTNFGTSGQVLTSAGNGATPTWTTPTGMTYPGAGIPNSTGSAWGTSYTTSGTGTVVALATSPTLVTPVLGTPTSGNLSNCTVDGTDSVGFRNIPVNSQSTAYTAVLADSGKVIFHPSTDANARTFTIPANSSVAYPIGTAITFINMTSQVVTIDITTDTMYLSAAGTTGSRSLAQYGSATAIKMTSTTWLISGSGLT